MGRQRSDPIRIAVMCGWTADGGSLSESIATMGSCAGMSMSSEWGWQGCVGEWSAVTAQADDTWSGLAELDWNETAVRLLAFFTGPRCSRK